MISKHYSNIQTIKYRITLTPMGQESEENIIDIFIIDLHNSM